MGKALGTEYSDMNYRILKKSMKKEKSAKHHSKHDGPKNKKSSKTKASSRKRKISGINDDDLPPPIKLPKLSSKELLDDDQTQKKEGLSEVKRGDIVFNKITAEKNSEALYLKIHDDSNSDLFLDDELRNSYINYINTDFHFHIIDEICLEGLDGITMEAFWKRLFMLLEGIPSISRFIKENIWKIIMSKFKDVRFYELPTPRGELEIFNRYDHYNWEIGVVMELAYDLPDIYPHCLVNDPKVQGSCANFSDRVDISETVLKLCFKDIEKKYGNKLAIVAGQRLRTLTLTTEFTDPLIEMTKLEYCLLERIGRSRRLGEATQGNNSLTSALKMDPKSVFHYRQQLYRNGLISKQFLCMKSPITDQNKTGKLIHLRRFFSVLNSKYFLIAGKAINILKRQPGYRIEIMKLKKMFPEDGDSVNRIFKCSEFRKYVKTDCVYPYRFMYPDSHKWEYLRKSGIGEKVVKCYELKNPHVNIKASWMDEHDDSDEDDIEADEGEIIGTKFYNMESFKELYYHIFSKGSAGCSVLELNKMIGLDKNSCRMGVKKLAAKGVVHIEKLDKGRQRSIIYKARCLELAGQASRSEPATVSSTSAPPSIKARMMEKQRAALSKSKRIQAKVENDQQNPALWSNTMKTTPKLIETETPQISTCHFLIQTSSPTCTSGHKEPPLLSLTFPMHKIDLTYRHFFAESFDINILLDQIKLSEIKRPIKANFEAHYSSETRGDPIGRLILLKAHLGEVTLNGVTCSTSEPPTPACQISVQKSKVTSPEEFMGKDPITVWRNRDKDVVTEIVVSTPPSSEAITGKLPELGFISERVTARTKMIIDVVNQRQVFEEPFKLLKFIQEEEAKTGYVKKMDRKSLIRILKRTTESGFTKVYKIYIYDGKMSKTVLFICHPSVNHDDDRILSACQQIKWKYFIGNVKTLKPDVPSVLKKVAQKIKNTASPFSEHDVMSSIEEARRLEKTKSLEMRSKYNKNAGKTNGHKPKFIRMRIAHELLFFLIYEQDRTAKPLAKQEVGELFGAYGIEILQDELQNLPTVYCKEISWKMFIPPLPVHVSWPEGWALMCDVILRLPVSVFCKLHNVPFSLPELQDTLRHPIKRFYLVKDLSEDIQTVTLYKRKYLFSIHESVSRLAHCGLVQYGPQKYKEKDQVFVYLNRRASLLDTSSSKPAYNKIEDKEYPKMTFVFNNQSDVDNYWFNMYGISMNTRLNTRKEGQLVVITDVSAKPSLMETIKSRTCEEVLDIDNGDIPGDHRGAAGVDSYLWSHLRRNWFWARKASVEDASIGLMKDRIDKVLPRIAFKNLILDKGNKIYLHKPSKDAPSPRKTKTAKAKLPGPSKPSKTYSQLLRKIQCKKRPPTRQYYDSVDKSVLKKIGNNRRVRWSDSEDKVLLLAKVADLFLHNGKYKKQFVPYSALRDVLHRVCPEGRCKTSRAVQRRMKILNKTTCKPLWDAYMNLLQLQPIFEYYSILVDRMWKGNAGQGPFRFTEKQITNVFIILMSYILRNQDEVFAVLQGDSIDIDHLSHQNLGHTEEDMLEVEESSLNFKDALTEDDIKRDVLKSVIHSSVVNQEYVTTGLQLLKVYQKYPDDLIRDAVEELRKSKTITYHKFSSKKDKLWQGPYHLSQLYIFYQFTTHNVSTAFETYRTFLALRPWSDCRSYLDFGEEGVSRKRYGQMIGVNEFFTFWDRVKFRFDLPQNMIILNPAVSDHDEVVIELAARYQQKLKRMQQENSENEQDAETDLVADRQKSNGDSNATSSSSTEDPDTQDIDDTQADVLDLTVDDGNIETINRLRTWVTDCISGERGRRSPSPEFRTAEIKSEEQEIAEDDAAGGNENNETATRRYPRDHVLTLEEIKEEMLRVNVPNEDRIVPYITDLSDLLNSRENNIDTPAEEQTMQRLKQHFVAQYAQLENIDIEDIDLFADHHMVRQLENTMTVKNMWEKVQSDVSRDMEVALPSVPDLMIELGGNKKEDFDFMLAIVDFVSDKGYLGATGQQLKDQFPVSENTTTISLLDIVKILVECRVFMQAGICTIHFVHYRHKNSWLVETEKPLEEQPPTENQSEQKKIMQLQMSPWHKISGELNKDCFKTWICCILSHCVDNPAITFYKLCEKFFFLKPVDVYYLLVILQDLGCVDMMCYHEHKEEYLFSKWEESKQRRATLLDDFNDVTITATNVSMTCLGSFIYHDQVLDVPVI